MSSSPRADRVSESSRKVIDALADTIIPSDGDGRPGALDLNFTNRFLDFLSGFKGATRVFVISCWLWEPAPLLLGKLSRFSRLSLEERTRVLEGFEHSRLFIYRGALVILKSVIMATFYNNPEVWPHLGYQGGCLSEAPRPVEEVDPD